MDEKKLKSKDPSVPLALQVSETTFFGRFYQDTLLSTPPYRNCASPLRNGKNRQIYEKWGDWQIRSCSLSFLDVLVTELCF